MRWDEEDEAAMLHAEGARAQADAEAADAEATAQPTRNDKGNQIPYHQVYFGCCNRTIMTREDIAQPEFCPFCSKHY